MAARVTVYAAQAIAEARRISTPKRVQIAHQMVAMAQADAAVQSGAWQAAYHVEVNGDEVLAVNDREAAVYIGFGTEDTPPHEELIQAGMSFGRYSGWQARG